MLTKNTAADIMSDMKTFTVRELDRQPGAVLDACDREGAVRVRRRDGRSYLVRPEKAPAQPSDWKAFLQKRRTELNRTFPSTLTRRQSRMVDDLLAGE